MVHNINTALYAIASNNSGITALLGTNPTRFYPYNDVPQSVQEPFVTYRRISTKRNHAMGADTKKVVQRFQIDCWDVNTDAAEALADVVRPAFNRFRGLSDTISISEIWLVDERELTALEVTFAKLKAYSMDFFVAYAEP